MITKKTNPNDAYDLFEIERQARAMRAEATRDTARAIGRWFSRRRAAMRGTGVMGLRPQHG